MKGRVLFMLNQSLTITANSLTKIDQLDRNQSHYMICWIPPANELKKGYASVDHAELALHTPYLWNEVDVIFLHFFHK